MTLTIVFVEFSGWFQMVYCGNITGFFFEFLNLKTLTDEDLAMHPMVSLRDSRSHRQVNSALCWKSRHDTHVNSR